MPPLPSTVDEETTALIESLNRRQKDISTFQITRLRDCKTTLAVQQQYATELREDLDAFAQQVEKLELAVEDQTRPKDRAAVKYVADEFRSACARMRKDMRSALLESKKAIDQQSRSNREELLRSSAANVKTQSTEKSNDDIVMEASNNVTETLRRTIGLMQGELERSVLSVQMLESSTATLRSTSSTHDTLNAVMGTSKQLITALEKADWMDRLIIFAALSFFILVVLFILKQRLVNRSIRLAFWWTRFVPNFGGGEHPALKTQPVQSLLSEISKSTMSEATEDLMKTAIETATSLVATVTSSLSPAEGKIAILYAESSADPLEELISTLFETESMTITSLFSQAAEELSHVEL